MVSSIKLEKRNSIASIAEMNAVEPSALLHPKRETIKLKNIMITAIIIPRPNLLLVTVLVYIAIC